MTRFARAKGSKASNERVREEATPWHVMKQQLEESLAKEKSFESKEKPKTARQLLKHKEESSPVTNDWAEFDKPAIKNTKFSSKIEKPTAKKIKKKKLQEALQKQTESNSELVQDVSEKVKSTKKEKHVTKNNKEAEISKKKSQSDSLDVPPLKKKKGNKIDTSEINQNTQTNGNETEKSKKKIANSKAQPSDVSPSKKKKRNKIDTSEITEDAVSKPKKKKIKISEKSEENSVTEQPNTKPTEKLSKRQKRNLKKKNQNAENANSDSKKTVIKKPGTKPDNRRVNSGENNSSSDFQTRNQFHQNGNDKFGRQRPNMKNHHLRKPKLRDDKEHQRRKPVQSTKMIINGMEIEVAMYDGFPVQKEDADRLKELKKQMILKGIPKSDIDAAMKLERRKAEKALARVRKQVCFHCRKSAHNVTDCPELDKEEYATGICFKCGSTEHTHFECKVTKSDDYRFAKCFICREQGHIAKQCPDNPKGLYPKGGACKLCGDVTHLKKDCPDAAREKQETTMTVKTISDSALESIEEEENNKVEQKKAPKKKIVKF